MSAAARAGKWLVALSIPVIIAGAVLTAMSGARAYSEDEVSPGEYRRTVTAPLAAGAALLVIGHAAVIAGPVLWVNGNVRVHRARELSSRGAAAQPFVAPLRNGAVTGLRFLAF